MAEELERSQNQIALWNSKERTQNLFAAIGDTH